MILTGITDIVQVVLTNPITTNEFQCLVNWTNYFSSSIPEGKYDALTNGTTPINLVSFEVGTNQRNVNLLTILNTDTKSNEVSILFSNASVTTLYKTVLKVGQTLQFVDDKGFFVNEITDNSVVILAKNKPILVVETDLYIVPTGYKTIIEMINISNVSGASDSFNVSINEGGEATIDENYIYYGVDVLTKTVFRDSDIKGLELNEGDVIRIYSTLGNLVFTLIGMEELL